MSISTPPVPDILFDFPVFASSEAVFDAVSSAEGLSAWWTLTCSGDPSPGSLYELGFGPGFDWEGRVCQVEPGVTFELELTRADDDWMQTRVSFALATRDDNTLVNFRHHGWAEANEHFRVSGFCWAMYLRLMKRYVESGEVVAYDLRLEA